MCSYFLSISDSGKGRIKHNTGGRLAARLLQALAENTVSEATEEGLVRLASGLDLTYTTATCTYNDGVSLRACIDAAGGEEPLLSRQVGVVIFCFDFTGTNIVTYRRGGRAKEYYSLPPPKDDFLFCPIRTDLSKASLDCLKFIDFPKSWLIWALARENGTPFEDGWLAKNPPDGLWKGKSPTSQRILTLSIHRYS